MRSIGRVGKSEASTGWPAYIGVASDSPTLTASRSSLPMKGSEEREMNFF
jgi:hypothetical protein